ncbi:MAG TPA: effector-associated domain EAD1-containing protein [Anaerolineae bacterium]|nr:effector-associated domain EAD1-containing protein [Anaerolineae bacterium]
MIVHQAIYGDKSGSYALLKTSLTDIELAKRICNVTDLLDRPSSGQLTQPVFRGFAFNDSYIFIKTFPDNAPLVRKGRVLSHTLIVEKDDLHQLNDLEKLFSHFLSEPDKDRELHEILFDDMNQVPAQIINPTSREAAAINGLLDLSDYENTLVWIGEEGYLSFITHAWSQLKGNLRATVKLGIGFSPQKVGTQHLSILYVQEEYANKWQTGNYCIVGKTDTGTLESIASFLLAGNRDKAKPLNDLIDVFGIIPDKIEDLAYLEKVVSTYKNLSTITDLNRLIVFCDLISKYSPDERVAKTEKKRLLIQITSCIANATSKQIIALKDAEWSGFSNAQQLIGNQVAYWVEKNLFNSRVNESITSVFAKAFDPENKVQWWKKAVTDSLKTVLENWKPAYAIAIWNWFVADHGLVKTLGSLIPTTIDVETHLVDIWPKPGPELAQEIKSVATDRKWLTLHGLSALQLYSPEESIIHQLKIDIVPGHTSALQKMGELIDDEDFIQLTVNIGESRLIEISGLKVANNASLLSRIDVKNAIWRQIWLSSIEQGNQPWKGISKPISVLFDLFEEMLKGAIIDPQLLSVLCNSDFNDLSDFKQRAEVWKHISGDVKNGFLNGTALGCVKLLDNKKISLDNFEEEIRIRLTSTAFIKQVIEDQTIKISTKIFLFEELSTLGEAEFFLLLNKGPFSAAESTRIGKLVLRNNWRKITDTIADKISTRTDLEPALAECQSLLGFFKRLSLSLSGHLSESISKEEWWSAFTELCYTLYSNGPTDMGLWGRAGGKNYDLPTKVTGREIWVNTINKMRNGIADVDAQKLLQEMLKDYPSNAELRQLNKTSR